jgi:hypothetical protein
MATTRTLALLSWLCGASAALAQSPGTIVLPTAPGSISPALVSSSVNTALASKQDYAGNITASMATDSNLNVTQTMGTWMSYFTGVQNPNPMSIGTSTTTATDPPRLSITRQTSHSGGSFGYVDFAEKIYLKVGAPVVNFEWAFTSIIDNYAAAGENVAGYFQANKFTNGPTWAMVTECSDKTVTPSSVNGALPCIEVDVGAAGLDDYPPVGLRGGITIGINSQGTTTPTEVGWGVRVTDSQYASYRKAFYVGGKFEEAGFDTSEGTPTSRGGVTAAAFRSGSNQIWDFSGTNVAYWWLNSGTMQYVANGLGVLNILASGEVDSANGYTGHYFTATPSAGTSGFQVNGTAGAVGFDTSTATLSGAAMRIAAGQTICVEATCARTLSYDSTLQNLNYKVAGTPVVTIGATGNMIVKGPIGLANWATGSEPSSQPAGAIGYDTTRQAPAYYNGTAWQPLVGTNASAAQVTATGATTARTLANSLSDFQNIISFGADLSGATDSAAKVSAAITAQNTSGWNLLITPGTLQLSGDVYFGPATVDGNNLSTSTPLAQRIQVSPYLPPATGGGSLLFQHLMPGGPGRIYNLDYLGKAYDATWNGYNNVYQTTLVAQQNGTTAQVVAIAPWGILNGTGNVWGMNPACLITSGTATGICYGMEVDVGNISGGVAARTYGIDLHGYGTNANYIGYRLTANSAAAAFSYGYVLDAGSVNPLQTNGRMFYVSGANLQAAIGFDISAGNFTTNEWISTNLILGPTPTGTANKIEIDGGSAGGANTVIRAVNSGGDASVNITMRSLGTGGFIYTNGANAGLLTVSSTSAPVSHITIQSANTGLPTTISCTTTDPTCGLKLAPSGNIIFGTGAALASATTITGLPLAPTFAGILTGTIGGAGQAAFYINTSSHKLCHSEGGGTWYDATGAACS